ncbi:MAG: 4-(cytidine 5'-diphospho)-2-C-methyl-D-erythritol kinase [Nitrospirota bacterium]
MKISPLSLKAPAKINWFLKIFRKREDGYHDIMSFIQSISLYDNLILEYADTIEIISDLDIPLNDNLIYKAAYLLKHYTSYKRGAKIVLHKNVPVSAGLGGGSSDAAYTLMGLNKLWDLRLSNEELSEIGVKIGSDIPFFLNDSCALVEGRGEVITPFKRDISHEVVLLLIKPPISISTAWAYSSFDELGFVELTKKTIDIKLFYKFFVNRDFASLSIMLENDLEKVVTRKFRIISELKERLQENGALSSLMTGSGPTVFGVFESEELAIDASRKIGADNWCRVVKTLSPKMHL